MVPVEGSQACPQVGRGVALASVIEELQRIAALGGSLGWRSEYGLHAQSLARHTRAQSDIWPHHPLHIQATIAGDEAVFAIATDEALDGSLPRRQTRLVQAWIEIHQEKLAAAWQLAVNGFRPGKIAPLQ